MTDEQIIKALEYCSKQDTCDEKCPFRYVNDGKQCYPTLLGNALDLINRKQKKIEKLEKIERLSIKIIEKQDVEIERLSKESSKQQLRNEMRRLTVEEIKTEAIKEFAERLKEISDKDGWTDSGEIDNLVKEMTETQETQETQERND